MNETASYFRDRAKKLIANKYCLITVIEIIFFLFGVFHINHGGRENYSFNSNDITLMVNSVQCENIEINSSGEGEDIYFVSPTIRLPKGIYDVDIFYSTDTNENYCEVSYSSVGAFAVRADKISLWDLANHKESTFWVNHELDELRIVTRYGGSGKLSVSKIEISEAWNSSIYQVLHLMVSLVVINIFARIIFFGKKSKLDIKIIVGISIITIISSIGLFTQYIFYGHDLYYHLLRIEGLKEGLLAGNFPVRIQPNWCNGWGFAISIFYGDTTLLLPALLRIIGMDIQSAYKCFVVATNIATAIVSYYCFHKMSKNKKIGLLCCMLYTLAPYRLHDIYIRASFGEYSAMIFLPLIALGFWHAFMDRNDDSDYQQQWVAPVIGFSGLIQSHLISCEMLAFFIILLCMIGIRKVIQKNTFIYLSKIVIYTSLLNLWFLIPFLSYLGEDLNCFAKNDRIATIQNKGITVSELLAPFATGNSNAYFGGIISLGDKPSYMLGAAFLIILVLFIFLLFQKNKMKNRKECIAVGILSVLAIAMTTIYFPYDILSAKVKLLNNLIENIQFPWRMLEICSLLLTVLVCFVLMAIKKSKSKSTYQHILVLLSAVCIYTSVQYIYANLLERNDIRTLYSESSLDTGYMSGAEFLYTGSDTWLPFGDPNIHGQGVNLTNYIKKSNYVEVDCKDTAEVEAYVEVPMFYYPQYSAYDEKTRQKFKIVKGEGNRIRIFLPGGYEGTLIVKYQTPFAWRFFEFISLISLIALSWIHKKEKVGIKILPNLELTNKTLKR